MDQPGKVANPARGQLNRKINIPLSPCVPENCMCVCVFIKLHIKVCVCVCVFCWSLERGRGGYRFSFYFPAFCFFFTPQTKFITFLLIFVGARKHLRTQVGERLFH